MMAGAGNAGDPHRQTSNRAGAFSLTDFPQLPALFPGEPVARGAAAQRCSRHEIASPIRRASRQFSRQPGERRHRAVPEQVTQVSNANKSRRHQQCRKARAQRIHPEDYGCGARSVDSASTNEPSRNIRNTRRN